jgi:hypothetical protein
MLPTVREKQALPGDTNYIGLIHPSGKDLPHTALRMLHAVDSLASFGLFLCCSGMN